jgi:hypothetical protein
MTSERLEKIAKILNATELTESHVQHLFVLARKLIATAPVEHAGKFTLLRFYCDWTVHPQLDRSPQAAQMIEKANVILAEHRKYGLDAEKFERQVVAAFSLNQARSQLARLISLYDERVATSINDKRWNEIVKGLAEIVSECPMKLDAEHHPGVVERIHSTLPTNSIREVSIFRGAPLGLESWNYLFSVRLEQAVSPPLTRATIEVPFF